MKRVLAIAGFMCLAAVGGLLVGNLKSHGATSTAQDVSQPISLGAQDTFDPPPSDAKPQMSAAAAWEKWQAENGSADATVWPSQISAYLGSLTSPIGADSGESEQYRYHDQLAYGFSSSTGCLGAALPPYMSPPAAPSGCTEWTFIDANTGDFLMIKFVEQKG